MKQKISIQLTNIEEVREFRRRLTGLELQLYQFQAITIRKNAEMLIVEPIQKRMRENGFSEKIVQNTYLREIQMLSKRKVRLIFSSILFADTGYDVALGREKGTRRHFVGPSKKKALHFVTKTGQGAFSKGHDVDGVPPLKIIETVIEERREIFQMAYDRDITDWIEKNMKGVEGFAY